MRVGVSEIRWQESPVRGDTRAITYLAGEAEVCIGSIHLCFLAHLLVPST